MNRNKAHDKLNRHMIFAREQQNGQWVLDVSGKTRYFDKEDDALIKGLAILEKENAANLEATRKAARQVEKWDSQVGEFVENDYWD